MTANLQTAYDRESDVLYITAKRAPADSREGMPGLFWRYSLNDGDLVGVTVFDYQTYWHPRIDVLAKQLATRFHLTNKSAKKVLENAER